MLVVETGFPALAVTLLDPLPVGIRHAVALVAERFWLFLELLAGVDEHHPPAVAGGLLVPQQPDVGEDARVVEELVGQHDDRVEPVVLQDPAADFALARAAVAVGKRRAVEDDGDAAAALLRGLHLGEHGLQEQQRPVVDARHAGLVAGLLQFPGFLLVAVLAAPGDAEGRIAEHEIEAEFAFGKLVARLPAVRVVGDERVAQEDLGLPVVLDQEIGLADGVVGGRQFLAVDGDELLDVLAFCLGVAARSSRCSLATDSMPPVPPAGS